jgi:hypothetical protein
MRALGLLELATGRVTPILYIKHMFEGKHEAALVDRIAELERSKSAGAAEQARLTVQLDTPAAPPKPPAECPPPSAGRVWAVRAPWRATTPRTRVVAISGSPAP